MRVTTTTLLIIVLYGFLFSQNTVSKFQLIPLHGATTVVQEFEDNEEGANFATAEGTTINTSQTIAIEITVKANKIPYRILKALTDSGYFNLNSNKEEEYLSVDVAHKRNVVKYKGIEEEVELIYNFHLPEKVELIKEESAIASGQR